MNCIYTVFYKNLKSYDGHDTRQGERLRLLELSVASYKRFNPDITFICDVIDEEIANTADMYFDKMNRIKELNLSHNVLWVDGDTLCLEDISDLFTDTMSGVFWGNWDGLNVINGGVIYYPKRYLYDNFDSFTKSWISLLSGLNERGEKFIGPHEQYPITHLMLKQFNLPADTSLYTNEKKLIKLGGLISSDFNINPVTRHFKNRKIFNECNTICGKKILHLNISEGGSVALGMAEYISENLLGYTHHPHVLLERCDDLHISNKFMFIKKSKNEMSFVNNTVTYALLYEFETSDFNISKAKFYKMNQGNHHIQKDMSLAHTYILKNILSGEAQTIKMK